MKLGIALSGGGIRGIAHAGALKAFEENGINIDIISGTSSGSIIATLYALGYSPYYIYILFKRYAKDICEISGMPIISGATNFIVNKKININGIKDGTKLEEAFNNLASKMGINTMGEIKMPILVPSVDIFTVFSFCELQAIVLSAVVSIGSYVTINFSVCPN